MCTHPIRILNRSRRFRSGIDKPVFIVPCGHCEECMQRKADDWFVRSCAEFKRVKNKGGFVWFITLTYRNEDLPKWIDHEAKFAAPVFDKSHFVAFRNKLRVYLKREGFDFTGDNTIRYLYVTEYGHKRGRSHLHVCLFVPSAVDFGLFKRLVAKAWIYGMVRYSPIGDTIKSVKALKYTMKYMHKDMLYYDQYNIDDYLLWLRYMSTSGDLVKRYRYKARLREFKRHLPHHCQSMGFGSDFVITDNEFVNDNIASSRLGLYDAKFNYKIPMYYKRRFLYTFDKVNTVYDINPRGKHIKQAQFNHLIENLEKYYASVIYSDKVQTLCKEFFPDLLNHPYYKFFDMLKQYDSRDIAIFSLVYDGVSLYKTQYDAICQLYFEFNNSGKIILGVKPSFYKNMNDDAYFVFCAQIDNLTTPLVDDFRNNGAMYDVNAYGYSDLPIYNDFSLGLQFLNLFECVLGNLENDAAKKAYYRQAIQFGKLFGTV